MKNIKIIDLNHINFEVDGLNFRLNILPKGQFFIEERYDGLLASSKYAKKIEKKLKNLNYS